MSAPQPSLALPQGQSAKPPPPGAPPDLWPLYVEVAESVRDYFRASRDPAAEPIMLAIGRMRTAIIALHHEENP